MKAIAGAMPHKKSEPRIQRTVGAEARQHPAMGVTYKRRFDRCHGYGLDLSGGQDTDCSISKREKRQLFAVMS